MSIENHFLHECDISRPDYSAGNVDSHGLSETTNSYAATGVKFRLIVKQQRIWISEKSESAVVTVYKGLFSADVDLEERDTLVNITLENGAEVDEDYIVEKILPRRSNAVHHISAELTRVS